MSEAAFFRLLGKKSFPPSCLKVLTHNNNALTGSLHITLCLTSQTNCLPPIYLRLYDISFEVCEIEIYSILTLWECKTKNRLWPCCAVQCFCSFPQTTSSYSAALESVFVLYCDCLVCSHIVRIWS